MKVISKEDAYRSVKNRVWYPPACDNKDEHIEFLFEGCREMDIVFCYDCKWLKCCKVFGTQYLTCESFCSWGERRKNDK